MSESVSTSLPTPEVLAHALGRLVSPNSTTTFLRQIWTRECALYVGSVGRFKDLFSWNLLNRAMSEHAFRVPRLRLYKDGRPVDPGSYMEMGAGREPRVKPTGLQDAMDDGATLILDHVHEIHRPLAYLRLGLERTFRAPVNINLYASTKSTKGFALHWDDHEVFALQIEGRKQWTVYKPTVSHPTQSIKSTTPLPTDPPVLDHLLSNGEVLYMPRGWWHLACSIDEPSLHLTIGIVPPTGMDLLHWVINRLYTHEATRRPLPLFGVTEEREDQLMQLKNLLASAVDKDSTSEYFLDLDRAATGAVSFNLPSRSQLQLHESTSARFLAPRLLHCNATDSPEVQILQLSGRKWPLRHSVAQRFAILNDGHCHYLSELVDGLDKQAQTEFERTLEDFVGAGLIEIDNGESTSPLSNNRL